MENKLTINQFKDKLVELFVQFKNKTNNNNLIKKLNYYINDIPYKAPEIFAEYYINLMDNLTENYLIIEKDTEWFINECNSLVKNTDW